MAEEEDQSAVLAAQLFLEELCKGSPSHDQGQILVTFSNDDAAHKHDIVPAAQTDSSSLVQESPQGKNMVLSGNLENVTSEYDMMPGHNKPNTLTSGEGGGSGKGCEEKSVEKAESQQGKMHLCRMCGVILDSSQDLLQHARQHVLNREDSSIVTCHVCSRNFPGPSHLVQHLQAHSIIELVTSAACAGQENERNVACTQCGDTFGSALLVYQHVLTAHAASDMLHCPLCSAKFPAHRQDNFLAHLHSHAADPDVQCTVCGKKFLNRARLATHMATHEQRSKKHLCAFCGKSFLHKYSYEKHMKQVHGAENEFEDVNKTDNNETDKISGVPEKLKYVCKICGKGHKSKGHLSMHMKNHVIYGPLLKKLRCLTCNLSFTSKLEKQNHVKDHHPLFTCPLCSVSFRSSRVFEVHRRKEHPDYRPFKCGKCDKTYKSDFDLFRHEMSHDGKRPYPCPHCPRQLWSSQNLQAHILVRHSGIERKKDVPCDVCGKLFYNKCAVKTHKRYIHVSVKKHKCTLCDKAYKQKQALESHMTVHTGELPVQCTLCGLRFRTHGICKMHVIDEHEGGRKRWKCQDCNSSFRQKFHLAGHVRKVHLQCFQCLEVFPSRDAAIKHRCTHKADLYMKRHGIVKPESCAQAVSVSTIVESVQPTGTTPNHEAFLEIVLAAESAERNSHSSPMAVAYTLTQAADGTGRPSIKLPRFKFRKQEECRRRRKQYTAQHFSAHSGTSPRQQSSDGTVTDVSANLGEPGSQETIASSVISKPVIRSQGRGPAVGCEPLSLDTQGNVIISSPSRFSGEGASKIPSQNYINSLSARSHSRAPAATTLFPADFPAAQDHDYGSVLSLEVVEAVPDELSRSILQSNLIMINEEPVLRVSQRSLSGNDAGRESVYPSDRLNPGTEIDVDDFFACLNEDVTAEERTGQSEDYSVVNSNKAKTESKIEVGIVARKRARALEAKKETAAENHVSMSFPQIKAPDTDSRNIAVDQSSAKKSCISQGTQSVNNERVIKVGEGDYCKVDTDKYWVPTKKVKDEDFIGNDMGQKEGMAVKSGGVVCVRYPDENGIMTREEFFPINDTEDTFEDIDGGLDQADTGENPFRDENAGMPNPRVHASIIIENRTSGCMHKGDTGGETHTDLHRGSSLKTTESQIYLPSVKQPITLQLMKAQNSHPGQQAQPPPSLKQVPSLEQPSSSAAPIEEPGPPSWQMLIPHQDFICDICDKTFRSTSSNILQAHLQMVHQRDEFYECQHCFAISSSFLLLTAHFEQHAMEHNLFSGSSDPGSGDVLNKPQQVGPLWEAKFSTWERTCNVFVAVAPSRPRESQAAGRLSESQTSTPQSDTWAANKPTESTEPIVHAVTGTENSTGPCIHKGGKTTNSSESQKVSTETENPKVTSSTESQIATTVTESQKITKRTKRKTTQLTKRSIPKR